MFATALAFTEPLLVASTPGAGQAGLVYPLAPVFDTAMLKKMRVNLFLQALTVGSTLLEVQVGFQLSDDGAIWPGSTTTPSFFTTPITRSAEGYTAITGFEDVSAASTKKYLRIVLWVKNIGANQALSTGLASVRVERQSF